MQPEHHNDSTPCLGGWCHLRDRCQNYRSDIIATDDIRLCPKGQDGVVPGLREARPVLVRTIDHKQEKYS